MTQLDKTRTIIVALTFLCSSITVLFFAAFLLTLVLYSDKNAFYFPPPPPPLTVQPIRCYGILVKADTSVYTQPLCGFQCNNMTFTQNSYTTTVQGCDDAYRRCIEYINFWCYDQKFCAPFYNDTQLRLKFPPSKGNAIVAFCQNKNQPLQNFREIGTTYYDPF